MKVLMIVRPDAARRHGGDVVLAAKTAEALGALGIAVTIAATASPDVRGFDVAHIFGVFEPEIARRQLAACRRTQVAVAISPIWLDLREVSGLARRCERVLRRNRSAPKVRRALERLRSSPVEHHLTNRELRLLVRREALQTEILEAADVLIPNGAIEARECAVKLGVHNRPFVVAPIPPGRRELAWAPARNGVLCVGRIETRKNQALLAFALRDDPIEVTCIGEAYDSEYFRICRRWSSKWLRFLGRLPDDEIARHLGAAAVHAMPSWCETAGMASLEAALAGAQLVVGSRGSEIEYFGNDADYADPADPESIRAAVLRAMRRPPRKQGDALDRRVRALTWRLAAERTKQAYEIGLRST